jgi:hypothetical protein
VEISYFFAGLGQETANEDLRLPPLETRAAI